MQLSKIVVSLHHNNKQIEIMKTITTTNGVNLRVGKVYELGTKFSGKVMVYFEGMNSPARFTIQYFNSIVEPKDRISI